MNCKNCGLTVDGNFCSHCGQSSNIDRINLSSFLEEISHGLFQVDKGLLFSFKELFLRPVNTIEEFLNGRRKAHFKPVAYALTFSTLYFLISRVIGEQTWMNEIVLAFSDGTSDSDINTAVPSILNWFSSNFAYTTLLLLPLYSIASYLSFLGLGRNYLEHFVLNAFVAGQQAIIYSITLLLEVFIASEHWESIGLIVSISYAFWMFWQFFSEGNRILNILRSILTYILYLIFCFVILYVFLEIEGALIN